LIAALETKRFLAMPVRVEDAVLGLLFVDQVSRDKLLGQRDLQLARQLCNTLGLTLSNARMVEKLRLKSLDLQSSLLLNQKFAHYLPGPVVQELMANPEAATKLGGRRLRAAVLFADIQGFTPWSERLDPEDVVAGLNQYFAAMDNEIHACHGIIDKRMGDGMMVVFLHGSGSFADDTDDEGPDWRLAEAHPARRALVCAVRMQRSVARLREEGTRFPHLSIRIGVAYGDLVAGNIGSHRRIEYTVIGDIVNVASRLERLSPTEQALTTLETLSYAGAGFQVDEPYTVKLTGRESPVSVVVVRDIVEEG
jgi:adenylate cyclase